MKLLNLLKESENEHTLYSSAKRLYL